jgi:hypothetical protein
MSIQSNLATPGLLRERSISSSGAVVQWPGIPLLVKVATMVVLSLMLIIFGVLSVARTGTISKILGPPRPYLPGNSLPMLPKDSECNHIEDDIISCIVHELGQDVYLTYGASSRMIVHTGLKTNESKIGELIIAWGIPSGFNQYDTSIFVYWGKCSAVLYTDSFRPESPVKFIQYDLEEQQASAWRGFINVNSVE